MQGFSESEVEESVYGGKLPIEQREFVTADEHNENETSSLNSTVVLTDVTDADGLGCATLYTREFDEVSILFAGYNSPEHPDVIDVFESVVANRDEINQIFISDLGQNRSDADMWVEGVDKLSTSGVSVNFRDHHQTPNWLKDELMEFDVVDYEWSPDDVRCASEVVWETDVTDTEKEYKFERLVELTSVLDLWKSDSDDFSFAKEFKDAGEWLGPLEYIEEALEHGYEITRTGEVGEYLQTRRTLQEQKLEFVCENATIEQIGSVSTSFVVGDCYQSRAAQRVFDMYGVDLVVVIKPSGKTSFRSADGTEYARRVAEELGGGGHATRAGYAYDKRPEMPEAEEVKQQARKAILSIQ